MNAEEFAARIIGRRYWFSLTRGVDSADDLAPVCLVAMRSTAGESWAAYIAGVTHSRSEDDAMACDVAAYGAKLDELTARAMFPDVALPYRQ